MKASERLLDYFSQTADISDKVRSLGHEPLVLIVWMFIITASLFQLCDSSWVSFILPPYNIPGIYNCMSEIICNFVMSKIFFIINCVTVKNISMLFLCM